MPFSGPRQPAAGPAARRGYGVPCVGPSGISLRPIMTAHTRNSRHSLYTLIETCRLNAVDPRAWLGEVLPMLNRVEPGASPRLVLTDFEMRLLDQLALK